MNMDLLGWSVYIKNQPEALNGSKNEPGIEVGRIITESSQLYRIASERGEDWGILTGSLRSSLGEKSNFPAVGDWITFDASSGHQHWIIKKILPRYSALRRKAAGQITEDQILASNIDYVFIVNALDGGRNFNLRGLERYITTSWESGAEPVVVLNKADLCEDIESAVLQAESVSPGVRVHAVSALSGKGFEDLEGFASPGATIVLTGPSGVGKSSIINRFAGNERMDTGGLREQDHRGRHTTTHRELVRLAGGGVLIDTPGLRELQLWADEESLGSSFSDVEDYAEFCKFRDCSHGGEPGCAVQQAVASGEIEHSRYESYLDMQKELRYLKSKQDIRLRKQLKARGKDDRQVQQGAFAKRKEKTVTSWRRSDFCGFSIHRNRSIKL